MLQPNTRYSLTVHSAVIRSDKPTKGLDAVPAPNPHQGNRVIGFLPDGRRVVVAHRPGGKGGMDFNKILGGKVFAVAADGISPVFEKDSEGKSTKTQKAEDGLPLFSASGFYLLSSKEYPSLDMFEGYTRLLSDGQVLLSLTQAQLDAKQTLTVDSEFDLDVLETMLGDMLSDAHSLVARHDTDINRKRERGVRRAKEEAEDASEPYSGVQFKELSASQKDGRPFVLVAVRIAGETASQCVLRQVEQAGTDDKSRTQYLSVEESLARFKEGELWRRAQTALAEGKTVEVAMVQGFVMRTSVSFRRKVENVMTGVANPNYGDAVYIKGALEGWVRGIVSVMHSMHPNFPHADYDAHYYVASPRQGEVGMNKKEPSGWTSPVAPTYNLGKTLF